jgi:hypothetical protein
MWFMVCLQFECDKMDSSELGGWWIDYFIFKNMEASTSGKCDMHLSYAK